MWTTAISLPVMNSREQDAAGFITDNKQYLENIPANMRDATRQDEIHANQMGYTADVVVEIDAAAYDGAGYFIDEATGDEYDIVRTFQADRSNRIQLTGKRRQHGKS